jgi:opacity protein-like surface antigen
MKKLSEWCPRSVLVLALLCAAGSASAADLGFYVVMDGTTNSADVRLSDFNNATWNTLYALSSGGVADPPTDVGKDTKVRGYNITVGYQLGSYFAIEGSYVSLGGLIYDYRYPGQGDDGSDLQGRWKIKTQGPTVSAVGLLPLGPYFSADAHAGFFFLDNKHDLVYDGTSVGDYVGGLSDSKTSLYYGAGVAWWITGQVALRAGYNSFRKAIRYRSIFESSLFQRDVTQYTLGIRYSYGY